jgi:hypothetical protein
MGRSRTGAIALCATLVLLLLVPSSTAANQPPRMPQSAADWAAMSAVEQATVMAFLEDELETQLASGTAQVREVSEETTIEVPTSPGAGAATSATITYTCMVQWVTIPGEGDWVRGGGWTDASDYIDRIYASRQGKQGQFLREGTLKANWYQDAYGDSHAENWTGYHWAFFWEYVHWVTKGWHGAQDNSVWLLGPDRYCMAETWL